MKIELNHKTAVLLMIITAMLWSTGGMLIKLVNWHPIAIASGRSLIAIFIMLPFVRIKRSDFQFKLLLPSMMQAMTCILFINANKLTTSANAIFLQFTAPIWVLIFSIVFLKAKIRKSDWVTIIVIFSGIGLFFIEDISVGSLLGNILALCSGITFAGMIVSLKALPKGASMKTVFMGHGITFLVGLPFYLTSAFPDKTGLFGLLLLGVFQLGISYMLYAKAIEHVSAIEGILIPVLEPIFNPIWVMLFVGETPSVTAFAGGFIVITTVILRSLHQQKNIKVVA